MHFYSDYALTLYNNGYSPIPIRPNSKIPYMSKGESWQIPVDLDQIDTWIANGKGNGGIGIKDICAIDFDIKDKKIAEELAKLVKNLVKDHNKTALIRIGLPPKFLTPVSAKSEIKKKWKDTWYDQSGLKQEIEFLSAGDQYFVGFGIHPDTQKRFLWEDEKSLLNTPINQLPTIDELDITLIEDKFDSLAQKAGWSRDIKKKEPYSTTPNRSINHQKSTLYTNKLYGAMANQAGYKELKILLHWLPIEWVDDYDRWIKIGTAVHHETGGNDRGWTLFNHWSKRSEKYTNRLDTMQKWESFTLDRGLTDSEHCSTKGTIIHVLQNAGVWGKTKKEITQIKKDMIITPPKKTVTTKKKDTNTQNENLQKEETNNIIKKIVKQFNEHHAVIDLRGKTKIMKELRRDRGQFQLSFSSIPDFHALYADKKVFVAVDGEKVKPWPISKLWFMSPERRIYLGGVAFAPTGATPIPADCYNLWKGLSIKKKQGDWSLFKDHIFEIIANSNQKIFEWILAWMARIVQSPGGHRPGTAIVLKGGQGLGKGIFADLFGNLLGEHYMPVHSTSQVAGRFNSHLTNKVLVFIDEAFWGGDKKSEGVLKSLVTEPQIAIEQKGIDIIALDNHINLIIASNNDWIVPANKQERRFFVLGINEKRQGDIQYFKEIITQMHKQNGLQAMLYDLLKLDITKYDLRQFEQTDALFEQKIHSMPTYILYWYEKLQEGRLLPSSWQTDYTDYSDWHTIKSEDQYKDYLEFSDSMKERYPLSPILFGRFLNEFCSGIIRKQASSGKRIRIFPDLNHCRKDFEKQYKYTIPWGDELL